MNSSITKLNKHPQSAHKHKTQSGYKLVKMHMVDGIYQGSINSSYQKDGLGILQTQNFQTYIGNFRYNKVNGVGLMFYTDGSIIYGHFINGELDGIAIADNQNMLQLGIFYRCEMIGIGFEYIYQKQSWRMNRYHKGVPIETVKQIKMNIEQGIPNMLGVESNVIEHFHNYRHKNYFHFENFAKTEQQFLQPSTNLNSFYYHSLGVDCDYFGVLINSAKQGLGLSYNPRIKKVTEVGMYDNNLLNGYGLRIDQTFGVRQTGRFVKGNKDGIFFVSEGGKNKFHQYSKGVIVFDDKKDETIQNFKKNQKIYNYRQKDFMSLRNNFLFQNYLYIFDSHELKAWKRQDQSDKKNMQIQKKIKNEVQKNIQSKSKKRDTPKSGLVTQNHQKSSVQIMKQKIFNISKAIDKKTVSSPKNKANKKLAQVSIFQDEDIARNKSKQIDMLADQNDSIAMQQPPIILNTPNLSRRKQISLKKYRKNE